MELIKLYLNLKKFIFFLEKTKISNYFFFIFYQNLIFFLSNLKFMSVGYFNILKYSSLLFNINYNFLLLFFNVFCLNNISSILTSFREFPVVFDFVKYYDLNLVFFFKSNVVNFFFFKLLVFSIDFLNVIFLKKKWFFKLSSFFFFRKNYLLNLKHTMLDVLKRGEGDFLLRRRGLLNSCFFFLNRGLDYNFNFFFSQFNFLKKFKIINYLLYRYVVGRGSFFLNFFFFFKFFFIKRRVISFNVRGDVFGVVDSSEFGDKNKKVQINFKFTLFFLKLLFKFFWSGNLVLNFTKLSTKKFEQEISNLAIQFDKETLDVSIGFNYNIESRTLVQMLFLTLDSKDLNFFKTWLILFFNTHEYFDHKRHISALSGLIRYVFNVYSGELKVKGVHIRISGKIGVINLARTYRIFIKCGQYSNTKKSLKKDSGFFNILAKPGILGLNIAIFY